jgi:hypothetical protein
VEAAEGRPDENLDEAETSHQGNPFSSRVQPGRPGVLHVTIARNPPPAGGPGKENACSHRHLVVICRSGHNIWRSPLTYLVVVAATEQGLYHYLKTRFEADTGTRVILDRRRGSAGARLEGERRASPTVDPFSFQRVAVIRLTGGAGEELARVDEPAGHGGTVSMEGIEALENRQRVDRWLEESQYLIGRLVPAFLEDRDRARARLEMLDQDNERLRTELGEARREIAELRAELELLRSERSSVAESFGAIMEHLAALQKPVNDISRRVHTAPPAPSEGVRV